MDMRTPNAEGSSGGRPAVFVFTTAYDPFIGGAEIAIAEVLKQLAGSFRFFVFTARFRRDLASVEEKGGAVIIRIGFGFPLDKFLLPLIGPFVVHRWTRKYQPALAWAVMVSFASGIPYILNIFRPWKKIPVVLTLQEGDSEAHLKKSRFGLINLSWRLALRGCSALTVISDYLGELARSFGYIGRVAVIPNGVDMAKFGGSIPEEMKSNLRKSLGLADDSPVVVTTSRLVHKNGVDILIDSLVLLPRDLRSWVKLLVIGGGPDEAALENRVLELGLSGSVMFLGEKPNHELPKYLKLADVFARASRSEGQGVSFIEAMAAGVPVVGTNVGGIPDFLFDRKTGLMVEPNDPEALAKAIIELLSDAGLRKKIAAESKHLIESAYDWKRLADSYKDVFLSVRKPAGRSILIATGIYPPEVGGSAKYAKTLGSLLKSRGFGVRVLTFGDRLAGDGVSFVSRTWPTGVRHLIAFFKALPMVASSDAVILFDHFSMGFPVSLASRIFRKPVILRVGGDFLWESFVESHRAEKSLPAFYQDMERLSLKERMIFFFSRSVMREAAEVVFSTDWLRKLFIDAYKLKHTKTSVIENAIEAPAKPVAVKKSETHELVYAGRFIFLKNLRRLLTVFREFHIKEGADWKLVLIGEGPEEQKLERLIRSYGMEGYISIEPPLLRSALEERIAGARAVAVPSFSDVSPNLVLESLALGVPAILTKYCGYDFGKESGVLRFDPLSERELHEALGILNKAASYRTLKTAAKNAPRPASFDEMADRYQELIDKFAPVAVKSPVRTKV